MNKEEIKYQGIALLKNVKSVTELEHNILRNLPVTLKSIKENGLYIFGVGKLGQQIFDFLILNKINVLGFLDNNTDKQKNKFNNLKVFSIDELSIDAIVYIASATYYFPIYNQLIANNITTVFSHTQAGIIFKGYTNFPIEMYQQNLLEDIVENKDKYFSVFQLLKDDESKNVFDSLLQYRLTLNHQFIINVYCKTEKEYFDKNAIEFTNNETYFDIGGFDGDSAEQFINAVNEKYNSVHIFEPDDKLIQKAKNRLQQFENIYYNTNGVYDTETTLYFNTTGGLDGVITQEGNIKIDTITIDNYCKEKSPTYIKYDVEGVEIEAINGSKETIKNLQPKLAIASYHYPKHLWQIPLLIKEINPNYTLQLRHYTDCIFDSIFYFI